MRKIITFSAALILIGVGVWTTKTTSLSASTETTVNPLQMMANAKNLPVAHYGDYTFVFN